MLYIGEMGIFSLLLWIRKFGMLLFDKKYQLLPYLARWNWEPIKYLQRFPLKFLILTRDLSLLPCSIWQTF
jgi:hypothetical protein